MKKLISLLILFLSSCQTTTLPAALPPTPSHVYYVAPNGNDNSRGTLDQPWQSVQKAANSGSGTIYVSAGTYPEQVTVTRPNIIFEAVGVVLMQGFIISANNITVKGFNITSPRIVDGGFGIHIYNDNCLIENNYIYSTVRDGILLEKTADNCIVKNNEIEHASQSGIEIQGTNHVIENNEIWDTIQYPSEWIDPPSWVDADGIRFFGSGHVIKGNYIHDINYQRPENIDPHIDCFQTWGGTARGYAHDITFDSNTCILPDTSGGDGTTKGFQISGGIYNLRIINNIIHARLIAIVDSDVAQTHDIVFLHNTFVGYPSDLTSWGINIVSTNYVTTNLRIQNNIFAYQENGVGSFLARNSATVVHANHNCVYSSTGLPSRAADPGDVWNKDPLFVNYSINDFRLQPDSPCIDKGMNVGVTYDLNGNFRPQGTGYDIGSFEFVVSP